MGIWSKEQNLGRLLLGFLVFHVQNSAQSLRLRNLLRGKAPEICSLRCDKLRHVWWFRNVLHEANCFRMPWDYHKFDLEFDLETNMVLVAELSGERTYWHYIEIQLGQSYTPYFLVMRWQSDTVVVNSKRSSVWQEDRRVSPIPIADSYNYTIEICILEQTFETFANGELMMISPRVHSLVGARRISFPGALSIYRFDIIV